MRRSTRPASLPLTSLLFTSALLAQSAVDPSSPAAADSTVFRFTAADGAPLEAKLTRPDSESPVPVVFYLHGAGPRTFDHPVGFREEDGTVRYRAYYDLHAQAFAARGVAFCAMSKRGCVAVEEPLSMDYDPKAFGEATLDVLLGDYERGLAALLQREGIDAERVVFWGSSEGTRLAPMLAVARPDGVRGLVLTAFAADNAKDTVAWQNSVGPWRNVQAMLPEARDGAVTREEYDAALERAPGLGRALPFDQLKGDDGLFTSEDLVRAAKPRVEYLFNAIENGDDERLRPLMLGLSSAYFKSWWDAPPTVEILLPLSLPISIFHGELDGTCRVEGVREVESAFEGEGKTNLAVHIYPELDHNLGWTRELALRGGAQPFRDAVDAAVRMLTSR